MIQRVDILLHEEQCEIMKKSSTSACPRCGTGLRLFGVERHDIIDRMALRTYVCPACDAIATDLVAMADGPLGSRREVSVYDPLGSCGFDDETTKQLGLTFDSAWAKLEASGGPLTAEPVAGATRELLARCIIALGRRLTRPADKLDEKALIFLTFLTQGMVAPHTRG
jgi:hypothetical protein